MKSIRVVYILAILFFAMFAIASAQYFPLYQIQVLLAGVFFVGIVLPHFLSARRPSFPLEAITLLSVPFCLSFFEKSIRKAEDFVLPAGWQYVFDPIVLSLFFLSVLKILRNRNAIKNMFMSSPKIFQFFYISLALALTVSQIHSVDLFHRSLPFALCFAIVFFFPLFWTHKNSYTLKICFFFILANIFIILPGLIYILFHKGFALDANYFLHIKMDVDLMVSVGNLLYGNSGHLADLSILLAPLIFCFIDFINSRLSRKIILWTSLGLLTYLFMTHYSRAVLLVFSGGFTLILIYRFVVYKRISLSILAFIAFILLSHLLNIKTMTYSFNSLADIFRLGGAAATGTPDASIIERESAALKSFKLIGAYMPLGSGWGTYSLLDPVFTNPHNNILLFLTEAGILGGVAYGALFFLLVSLSFKAHRQRDILSVYLISACWILYIKGSLAGSFYIDSGDLVPGFLFSSFLVFTKNRLGGRKSLSTGNAS